MQLNYFFDDSNTNNEQLYEDVTKLYNDEVGRLHKIFDRHNSYYDENGELIVNIKTINDSFGSNTPIKCSDELYELLTLVFDMFIFCCQ